MQTTKVLLSFFVVFVACTFWPEVEADFQSRCYIGRCRSHSSCSRTCLACDQGIRPNVTGGTCSRSKRFCYCTEDKANPTAPVKPGQVSGGSKSRCFVGICRIDVICSSTCMTCDKGINPNIVGGKCSKSKNSCRCLRSGADPVSEIDELPIAPKRVKAHNFVSRCYIGICRSDSSCSRTCLACDKGIRPNVTGGACYSKRGTCRCYERVAGPDIEVTTTVATKPVKPHDFLSRCYIGHCRSDTSCNSTCLACDKGIRPYVTGGACSRSTGTCRCCEKRIHPATSAIFDLFPTADDIEDK